MGRLFSRYGLGVSNLIRGNAIKVAAMMELHRMVSRDLKYLELLREVWPNVGIMPQLPSKYLGGSPARRRCYICSDRLELLIGELFSKAVSGLSDLKVRSFVVSVLRGSDIERRELEVVSELKLDSWENVRRELKRELGKRISMVLGIEPDFKHPDAIVVVDLNAADVKVRVTPLYAYGRYVKLGRYIPQTRRVASGRKYALALEDLVEPLARSLGASGYKIHTAGREGADARMLGGGRPLVIELRGVRDKTITVGDMSKAVPASRWLVLSVERAITPRYISLIKTQRLLKLYRLLILSKKPLDVDSVNTLVREFNGRDVRQRAPDSALRRGEGVVRVRRVYGVGARLVNEYLMEVLAKCDSGLHVRELVHGDNGRTSPSFAEVLGTELVVLEVDVLDVLQG